MSTTLARTARRSLAKGRMVKHYYTTGDVEWWGDCPLWAQECLDAGVSVRVVHVMRFGPPEDCTACLHGLHSRTTSTI